MTAILGLSAYYHDSAACLLVDGRIVAAAQEERFTRKKHDSGFPLNAARWCLAEAGLSLGQLDHVAFYDKPLLKFERLFETYLEYAPRGFGSFRKSMPLWISDRLWMSDRIGKDLGWDGKVLFGDHHESHAASAFYPSPYEEAAILTMDGVGEWATSSIGSGRGNAIDMVSEMRFPHSVGLLYSAFTYFCGFKVNSGEYKLMGLAPYGEPRYADLIREKVVHVCDDGSIRLNMEYFTFATGLTMTGTGFERLFGGPAREAESNLTQREMDLARSIQDVTEEIVLKMARHARKATGATRLCMAGGVALNCVANGKLREAGIFEDLWIQPAAGDAGGAVGAALSIWHRHLGMPRESAEKRGTWRLRGKEREEEEKSSSNGIGRGEGRAAAAGGDQAAGGAQAVPRSSSFGEISSSSLPPYEDGMSGAFLGPSYPSEEIAAWLESRHYPYRTVSRKALPGAVAELLAEGKVVGLLQGRMEFGPRALGGRSILGDPRSAAMQSVMNLKIKFRESFRPFAPSVLREDVAEWFDLDGDSPYMLLCADVARRLRREMTEAEKALWGIEKLNVPRSAIPAVTHVDYSARLQTVRKETNPLYHAILSAFRDRTGCPVVVNTSFNVRGEPIVRSPEDAYRCFMRTAMDALVLENNVLVREGQPAFAESEDWKKTFTLD
ncbi:MAG TPA: carbamoyltransferase [Thermoanaerobaculia bacterium]|nr:carbamoyltransferase [Thermoanaerobaculia bacterium]